MGLFRRRTKFRVVGPAEAVPPGRELAVALEATRVRPDAALGTVYAEVEVSARKDALSPQGEGLQATSVSTWARVVRHEIAVDRPLTAPEDAVELKVWLPWWTPVVRVGEHRLLGSLPRLKVEHGYGETGIETEALPFHHALFTVADQLGWSYRRTEVWDVGGTKRPVEQRLWFAPGDEFEGKGFKLAHVEVVPVAGSAEAGTLAVTVFGRKLGPGLFPLGRLDVVPLTSQDPAACATALREGLAKVVGGSRAPAGVELDGQAVEALLRVLLR